MGPIPPVELCPSYIFEFLDESMEYQPISILALPGKALFQHSACLKHLTTVLIKRRIECRNE
jgi:hypothetical protein